VHMGTILWTKISYFHPIQQSVNLREIIYHNNILLIYVLFIYVANISSEIYICHRKKWNFGRGWVWNNFNPNTHWASFFEQVNYIFTQSNKVQTFGESKSNSIDIHWHFRPQPKWTIYISRHIMRLWEGGYETSGIQTHMGSNLWNKKNPISTHSNKV